MTQKEINELKRRFKPEKSGISHIYGCYVNTKGEIVSYIDEALGRMPLDESEKYLGLLKKALSGTLGRNLIDIVFSTEQVADSDEHRLLSALRESELKNGDVRQTFYDTVIDKLDMGDSNYLILLAFDAYDVPRKSRDGQDQDSDTVFTYIVCCVCPVKNGKPELGFFPGENEFHSFAAGQVVSAPELGFLFPAFDDRAANIYNALYYAKKPDNLHQEFIDAVFHIEPPMSAAEQKETFEGLLTDILEEQGGLEVVQSVHERLRGKLEDNKDSADPAGVTAGELGDILQECGVDEKRLEAFQAGCAEKFGEHAVLSPGNLIDSGRFEVRTADASISVNPEYSFLVETRVIDGKTYLLIPAGDSIEINGMTVRLEEREE